MRYDSCDSGLSCAGTAPEDQRGDSVGFNQDAENACWREEDLTMNFVEGGGAHSFGKGLGVVESGGAIGACFLGVWRGAGRGKKTSRDDKRVDSHRRCCLARS